MALHQVPLAEVRDNPEHLALLEEWMRSYKPEELFDDVGPHPRLGRPAGPDGERRMGATPYANGGRYAPLDLPDFRDYALEVTRPDGDRSGGHRRDGRWLRT